MENIVQIVVVINFIVIGLSMAFRPNLWVEWVNSIREKGIAAILSLGMISLFLGSLIVSLHWVWTGFPMLITIIGVIMVLDSCFILTMPKLALNILNALSTKLSCFIALKGGVLVIIGVLLLYKLEVATGILPSF